MDLVGYSDSENSADEKPTTIVPPTKTAPAGPPTASSFAVDRSNPRKIKVNLQEIQEDTPAAQNEGPAPKRQRTGGGMGAFNAMLPAPRKNPSDNQPKSTSVPRKLFSLKTGAEPGFSRESDAELRQMFAEQDAEKPDSRPLFGGDRNGETVTKSATTKAKTTETTTKQGPALTFKPLSVARNGQTKKKKALANALSKQSSELTSSGTISIPEPKAPKVNLFSFGTNESSLPPAPDSPTENAVEDPSTYPEEAPYQPADLNTSSFTAAEQPQTLSSLATDLNLPPSARRQLLGRSHKNPPKDSNPQILTFNTDAEYSNNSALLASGALAAPHNPVRAIAPGKHSLKQLVSSASGQLDALEESFAQGRRNRSEAAGKYGW